MNNKALQYNSFIKRQIIICTFPWIVPIVDNLTREKSDSFGWMSVLIVAVVVGVIATAMYVARRLYLGALMVQDLDFQTVYELDKRSTKKQKHNWTLLMNVYFYGGYVNETRETCEKLLSLEIKQDEEYGIYHQKIMLVFLCGDTVDLETMIAQQKQRATQKGVKIGSTATYYRFIQLYLQEQYADAVEVVKELLKDEIIEINNLKKVMVFTLMYMAYEKLDDTEQMQMCKANILQADPHFRTVFSRRFLGE